MKTVDLTNNEIFDLLETHNKLDRELFTKHYGWTYPTKESLKKIIKNVKNKSVLELGSGLGLWTKLLSNSGVDITAVDDLSWHHSGSYFFYKPIKMDAIKAVRKYKTDVLLMGYPIKGEFCNKALDNFKGDILVYIGEFDEFLSCNIQFIERVQKNWILERIDIEHWKVIHDEVVICKRK